MERTVSVLLTRYSDWTSRLVYFFTGWGFTHASIALEETGPYYYSFNFKGFCRETLEKHRRRGVQHSMEIQLLLPEEAYRNISHKLRLFQANAADLRYTRLGVVCAAARLPFHWRGHYFCSQFVADLLLASGTLALSCPACLCLPNQLMEELAASPLLAAVQRDVV